jgi:hypothetical protein
LRRPDLSSAGGDESNPQLDLGSGNSPDAANTVPKKRSAFYRKAIEIISRGGSRAVVAVAESKLDPIAPIIGESECAEEAESFAFPDEDLNDMKEAMADWEERDGLPDVHPAFTILAVGANYAAHTFVRFKSLDRRIAKMTEAIEERNRIERMRGQRAQRDGGEGDKGEQTPEHPAPPQTGARAQRGPSAKERSLDRESNPGE